MSWEEGAEEARFAASVESTVRDERDGIAFHDATGYFARPG
jgi:hypothetical protein